MRARPFLVLALLSAILIGGGGLTAGARLSAQAMPSATIAEIRATGSQHFAEAQIVALAGLKPGDSVTREHLQAVANYLAQLGLFTRVNYRFTTQGAGIALEFQIEDAPVAPVTFDNFPWFSDEELLGAVRQAVPVFDGLAPHDGSLLNDISAALAMFLQTHGVPGTIQHMLLARPASDEMTMQFRVEGPALTIESLSYTDALAQNSPRLRDRRLDVVGKPFSRFAIELFVQEQVRPLYLTNGHLRVRFDPPRPGFTTSPDQPLPSQVAVVLPIDPGPAFRLADVNWTGNTVLNAGPLDSLVTLKRGDVADGMALAAVWQRVEREYARRGYVDAKVNPQPEFSDAQSAVSYIVAIDEGPQYRMGQLVITGLSLDAERAVRAAWRLFPGNVFDGAYVEDLLAKLEKPTPEIFGRLPVHYSQVGHLLEPGEQAGTMDVMIDFQR
jgi:outer membrane protein assembly factor BamA